MGWRTSPTVSGGLLVYLVVDKQVVASQFDPNY
jgi:hypothetical protein